MIEGMDVYSIMMPMRRPFVHASMTRDHSDGVLVAISVAGAVGTGESAPRPYVTGETTETVIDALSRLKLESIDARIDWSTFETSVQSLIGLNLPQLLAMGSRRSPAAACALETALLDAICRLHGASMFDALSFCSLGRGMLLSAPQVIAATLTIDLSMTPEEVFRMEPALSRGIRHVKIKVGADERSIAKARRFKDMLEPGISTSIDANGAWSLSQALPLCRQLKEAGLGWIEEPKVENVLDLWVLETKKLEVQPPLRIESRPPVNLPPMPRGRHQLRLAAGSRCLQECVGIVPGQHTRFTLQLAIDVIAELRVGPDRDGPLPIAERSHVLERVLLSKRSLGRFSQQVVQHIDRRHLGRSTDQALFSQSSDCLMAKLAHGQTTTVVADEPSRVRIGWHRELEISI